MQPTSTESKLPVTRILFILVGALAIAGIFGGFCYLDYHSGSLSSAFHPNGMELSLTSRGFNSGTTSVGTIRGGEVPFTFLANVEDHEFKVTATEVMLDESQIAEIPPGTKKVSIVSYRESTTIEADGARIATVE